MGSSDYTKIVDLISSIRLRWKRAASQICNSVRWSYYRTRYRFFWLLGRIVHIALSLVCGAAVLAFAMVLTGGQYKSLKDFLQKMVFPHLFTFENKRFVFDYPSADDAWLLIPFLIGTTFFGFYFKKWSSKYPVLFTFTPLRYNLESTKDILVKKLKSMIEVPRPSTVSTKRYDENLENIRDDFNMSIVSAKSFFEIEVDPLTIEHSFDVLLDLQKKATKKRVTRIVACFTLKPRQWLNAPMVNYLLATLGLASNLATEADKRRYYYVPTEQDEYDNRIISHLGRIHVYFGFIFGEVSESDVKPIIDYQKDKYGCETPDPAFLFIEFDSPTDCLCDKILFYRIAFHHDPRGPFSKAWIHEPWDTEDNRSVLAYGEVVDKLCPVKRDSAEST